MIDLSSLTSPVLLAGNDATAFRDPAVLFHNDTFHLYYTLVEVEADQYVYSYTAVSTSTDLVQWTAPEKITPRDQKRLLSGWLVCDPGGKTTTALQKAGLTVPIISHQLHQHLRENQ